MNHGWLMVMDATNVELVVHRRIGVCPEGMADTSRVLCGLCQRGTHLHRFIGVPTKAMANPRNQCRSLLTLYREHVGAVQELTYQVPTIAQVWRLGDDRVALNSSPETQVQQAWLQGGSVDVSKSSWIICRVHSRDDGVLRVAEATGLDPRMVVGIAIDWFHWVDQHCTGSSTGLSRAGFNHVLGWPATSSPGAEIGDLVEAFVTANWIRLDADGYISVCGYEKNFSKSAKRKALEAKRKAGVRKNVRMDADTKRTGCGRNADPDTVTEALTDTPPYPPQGDPTLFRDPEPKTQREGARRGVGENREFSQEHCRLIVNAYPVKRAPRKSEMAVCAALLRIWQDPKQTADPVRWLLDRTELFAMSPLGKSRYAPNAEKWFDGDCYLEEPSTWVPRDHQQDKPLPQSDAVTDEERREYEENRKRLQAKREQAKGKR